MSLLEGNTFLTRFYRLLFGRSRDLQTQSRSRRTFMVEPLEERQLLAVDSGLGGLTTSVLDMPAVIYPQYPGYYVDTTDGTDAGGTDATSASLAAVLAASDAMSGHRPSHSPVCNHVPIDRFGNLLSDDVLSDDVGVSYSLRGMSLTLEDELPAVASNSKIRFTSPCRTYGPMTYAEYLASLPLSPGSEGDDDDMPTRCCCCGGGCGCGCSPAVLSMLLAHVDSCFADTVYFCACGSSQSTELFTFWNSNCVQVTASACFQVGCNPGAKTAIVVSGTDVDTYWSSSQCSGGFGTFMWTKPSNKKIAECVRDFTFTAYVYTDTNNNGKFDAGDVVLASHAFTVHIAYVEVTIQFAGQGAFESRTNSVVQSEDNTVVVGQKVHAKIETSDPDKLSVVPGSIAWGDPSGGYVVHNYITNDNVGQVEYLTDAYNYTQSTFGAYLYWSNELEFYYTSNNVNKLGSVGATFNLTGPKGNTCIWGSSASYYVETPEVVSYTGQFAQFQDGTTPADVRPFGPGNTVLQLGGIDQVTNQLVKGIEWTANVTPTPYAGGQITYVQLANSYTQYRLANQKTFEIPANDKYYLDGSFPYGKKAPVDSTLKDDDSPLAFLEPGMISLGVVDSFITYLMYQPSGINSIWISLRLMEWGWGGKAIKQANGSWTPDPIMYPRHVPFTNSVNSVNTSELPVWSGRVQDVEEREMK